MFHPISLTRNIQNHIKCTTWYLPLWRELGYIVIFFAKFIFNNLAYLVYIYYLPLEILVIFMDFTFKNF